MISSCRCVLSELNLRENLLVAFFFLVTKGIAGDRPSVKGEKSKRERAIVGEVLGRHVTFLHPIVKFV